MFRLDQVLKQYVVEHSIDRKTGTSITINLVSVTLKPGLIHLLSLLRSRSTFLLTTDLTPDLLLLFLSEIYEITLDKSERNSWIADVISFLSWAGQSGYLGEASWKAMQDTLKHCDQPREDV